MITVVCVYNNKDFLKKYLLSSLKKQNINFEKILINNIDNKFASAGEAFNQIKGKVKGDFLMFVHQDVSFQDINFLKNLEEELKKLSNLGISGLAGRKDHGFVISNIKQGNPSHYINEEQIIKAEQVQTVDENLFIMPRNIFGKHSFNEYFDTGWHLYSVEFCLRLLSLGYQNYVIPLSIYHKSEGFPIPESYFKGLEKVLKKYNSFDWIYTTCGTWSTKIPLRDQRNNNFLKRIMNILKYHGLFELIELIKGKIIRALNES